MENVKISCKDAKSKGLTRYYTGKPCKFGHIDFRYVSDSRCAECARIKTRREYRANPEKIKRHQENRKRRYHSDEAVRQKAIADTARWVAENKERSRKYHREHYKKNKEALLLKDKARREERKKDPEWVAKERARNSARKKANPEKSRSECRTRRARKRGAEGKHTAKDIELILDQQKYKCVYCKINIKDEYDVDHIVPLSKGGSNWPSNLQCLCPPCNGSKWAKDPIDFAQEKGMLL